MNSGFRNAGTLALAGFVLSTCASAMGATEQSGVFTLSRLRFPRQSCPFR